MDVRQLRYFIRIAALGSFARASDQLNVAQTALGYQIRNLEEELEVKLFDRHSRGIELTAAGAILLERSINLVRDFDDARQAVRELRDPLNGRIAVGLTPTVSHFFASPLIQACAERYPHLKLSVIDGPSRFLVDLVLEEKIDVCCAYDVPDDPRFERTLIVEEELYLVDRSNEGSANGDSISFDKLGDIRLVLPSMPHNLRALVEKAASHSQISLNIVAEVQGLSVTTELVRKGLGATILPSFAVQGPVGDADLRISRIFAPVLTRPLWFACSGRRRLTAPEAAVLSIIQAFFERQPSQILSQNSGQD